LELVKQALVVAAGTTPLGAQAGDQHVGRRRSSGGWHKV
jgi:hypothetical protein